MRLDESESVIVSLHHATVKEDLEAVLDDSVFTCWWDVSKALYANMVELYNVNIINYSECDINCRIMQMTLM